MTVAKAISPVPTASHQMRTWAPRVQHSHDGSYHDHILSGANMQIIGRTQTASPLEIPHFPDHVSSWITYHEFKGR